MINKIFEDERVVQLHICNDEKAHAYKITGFCIQVESAYPSFKGMVEDEEGEYTIEGMKRNFYVVGDTLDDALKNVYERLQEV